MNIARGGQGKKDSRSPVRRQKSKKKICGRRRFPHEHRHWMPPTSRLVYRFSGWVEWFLDNNSLKFQGCRSLASTDCWQAIIRMGGGAWLTKINFQRRWLNGKITIKSAETVKSCESSAETSRIIFLPVGIERARRWTLLQLLQFCAQHSKRH